ncbi:MAG: cation diffusion facilitator family transporter [Clostridia bacterium]|nr:cation diffusion facilitator family transporter [Clostridia bacterium]
MDKSSKKAFFAVIVAAAVNIGLFFIKLYIGLSSNSVAIYADSLNNLLDSGVCIAAVIGLAMLNKKRTDIYPFGMGKAENLIEFIISVAIIFSGAYFGYTSFERIMYPMPIWFSTQYAVIIAATAVIKLLLAVFLKTAQKRNTGGIIKGIAADSLMDFFITLCSLISFTLASRIGYSVDGVAGIIISITMTVQGIKSAIQSCSAIIGKNETELCQEAKKLLESHSKVLKVFFVSCHKYGQNKVFTAEIESDCATSHEIKEMYDRLKLSFKNKLDAEIYISFGGSNEK